MNTLRKRYDEFCDEVVKGLLEALKKFGRNINEKTPGFNFYKFNQLAQYAYLVEIKKDGTIIYFMDNIEMDWDDPNKPVEKISLSKFIKEETLEEVSYFPLSRSIELLDAINALLDLNKQEDPEELKAQLAIALEEQDYERCSKIRDRLKKFQPA